MSLQIKTYYAQTVEAALGQARQQLGEEAMLLHSRRTTPEAKHLGEYEVAFVVPPTPPAAVPEPVLTERERSGDELAQDVADLRRQMARVVAAISRSSWSPSGKRWASQELCDCYDLMLDQEFQPELAEKVVDRVEEQQRRGAGEDARHVFAAELATLFDVDAAWGASDNRRIVALVGPAGGGKTTALAKLAAEYGIVRRRATQILTTDVERIAAAEQLRTYATILGAGFHIAETPTILESALADSRRASLVLIDTPGFGPSEQQAASEWAQFFAARPEIQTHLVLPATMRAKDLTATIERFAGFHTQRLLFTHLDETRTVGPLISAAHQTGCRISFLSCGQQVPEDLRPATCEGMLGLLFGRPLAARQAA